MIICLSRIVSEFFLKARNLAVWILAAKVPDADLNFAVDLWVDFFLLFLPRKKGPKKSTKKIPREIHPGLCSEKIPLGFLQKPFLDSFR